MVTFFFSFLVVVLAVRAFDASNSFDCQWKTANATYDLCHLKSSSFYEVYDDRDSKFFNFTYIFNVASDIESRPPDEICWNNTLRDSKLLPTGYCEESNFNETDGECLVITDITSNTAAYQIHRGINNEAIVHDCYRLHDGETAPTWSYIDAQDPSQGVKLTYTNGDWCDAVEKNREFSLEFYCSEKVENIPDKIEEIISEDVTCSYVLEIESAYGCPSECPITDNKLCGGHGICEFDYFNSKPQCYCYYGYCGADCSLTGSQCAESDNLLFNVTAPNDDESCLFSLQDSFGINSFYDLSFFDLKNENFVVDDMLDREYIYKFNVCGDMDNFESSVPPQCTNYNHGPCTHWAESTWAVGNETQSSRTCDNDYDTFDSGMTAKAVQIYYPKKRMYTNETQEPMCFWLGTDLPEGFGMKSYNVTLIDEDDSGRGVVYKILNGEYCKEDERNRELNLKLTCPDTRVDAFDPYDEAKKIINESVLESGTCVYEIGLESPLACPMTCISVKVNGEEKSYFDSDVRKSGHPSSPDEVPDGTLFSVCSNRGVCVSDPEASRVRCLCDSGWTGIVCETMANQTNSDSGEMSTTAQSMDSDSSGGKGLGIGLGIGIAVLLLLVVGSFWYLQRKKRVAVNAYGNLQHGDGLMLDDALEAGR